VLTSRIRQAIFAVQIFIQRCLMGFEIKHGVAPGQIDAEEWKTISRQAVWAARGKALLYPEELLNPAWRDNKSRGSTFTRRQGVSFQPSSTCVWPWWCPVYRWREFVAGAGMEQENLSSR
jgi:hypothetical protein